MNGLIRVAVLSFAWIATSAYADVVRVLVRDTGNNPLAADVCLFDPQSQNIMHGVADAAGRYEFTVATPGTYAVVASGPGWVGVNAQMSSHQSAGQYIPTPQLGAGNELNGPICKSSLKITNFVANNKEPRTYSNNIPIQFSTSVTFGKPVEYCISESQQGIVNCRSGAAQWHTPQVQGIGSYSFSDIHELRGYRDLDLTLLARFKDQSQTAVSSLASIFRSGLPMPGIMTGSFQINSGAAATDDSDVHLSWTVIASDPGLRIEHCVLQVTSPGANCPNDGFQMISPTIVSNGIATYESTTSLTGNSGMKNLALEIRYADYPDVKAGPARDGIVWSENFVSEFPCFASNLGAEVDLSTTDTGNEFEYLIPGEEAWAFALQNGFSFSSSTSARFGSCWVDELANDWEGLPSHGMYLWSAVSPQPFRLFEKVPNTPSGSCTHQLFENRTLNAGWTFKSMEIEESLGQDVNGNGVIDETEDINNALCNSTVAMPVIGGNSLSTKVTVRWPELPIPMYQDCHRIVTEIRLRGPACANWRNAFAEP